MKQEEEEEGGRQHFRTPERPGGGSTELMGVWSSDSGSFCRVGTLEEAKPTQGTSGRTAACLLCRTLAVLLVGLFLTLSRRLRKRLRARQDAGTVQAVNTDGWTCRRCCCRRSSMACCRWSGCRWAMDSCRLTSTGGALEVNSGRG